jgi:histidinol dehydrogenase
MPEINLHELAALDAAARARLLRRTESDLGPYLEGVKPILEAVRTEGDAALVRFGRELDKADIDLARLRVPAEAFERAMHEIEPDVLAAIEVGIDNIRRFHEAQRPEEMWMKEVRPGVFAGDRFLPIDSVACYVPRGKGAFPSVVMMTTIPAKVAGVPRIVVVTPPGPDGDVDAATLVVAKLVGIDEVYAVGGAQAVAAVAYGTETVPKCLKIVGPGSPWVVAAKRLLSDVIDPGVPAGPSEVVILADETADPALAALDLIIESEHGPDSSAYLVTPSRQVAEAARRAIPEHWKSMGAQRVGFSSAVLSGPAGGIVLARDMDDAVDFVNAYAPEHLEILGAEPFALLGRIRNAGEILLGDHTPVTLGNFVLGPNAVLPTNGAARTHSPLSTFDFMKRNSIGYVTAAGYSSLAPHAERLARYEGFEGHANAVSATRDRILRRV